MLKKTSLSPAAKLLGFNAISRTRGKAFCRFKVLEGHINLFQHIHGGILCMLADETMGKAFLTSLAKNQSGVTVELKIQFMRPVFLNTTLHAKAHVVSKGKTLSFLECEILGENRKLVAKATATLMIKSVSNHSARVALLNRLK